MRTTSIFLIAIALIFAGCKKKDISDNASQSDGSGTQGQNINPEQRQNALVLEYTATWCPYCGAWGHDSLTGITNHNGDRVVPVVCHVDDGLTSPCYNGLSANYPDDQGIPNFIINEDRFLYEYQPSINSVLQRTPVAQTNFIIKKSGQSINLTTQTKFFTAVSGADYYLAMYALEDGIDGASGPYKQVIASSHPAVPNYKHNHTLRAASCNNSALGAMIVCGTAASGTTINSEYTINCPSDCNMANMTVAAIIWKKVGGVVTFVNAFEKK
ncbi:MAG: Omp28-related outer membrane protein [Bacteroidota bacterium]